MKTSKLRVTDLCVRNSPVTTEFPTHYDVIVMAWYEITFSAMAQ